ncbi:MAG: LemA family protein [Arenicellales bacterium]
MSALLILLVLVGLVILYGVFLYNRFVKDRNTIDEAWSGIDVQLKRRHNLIPNLVETVKGYAHHEADVLEKVTAQRTGGGIANVNKQETEISKALANVFAVAENYPNLKANENFLDLQKQLSEVEDQIQLARRYYNGAVRIYNTRVESVPSNLIASFAGFTKREFFEIGAEEERAVPKVAF